MPTRYPDQDADEIILAMVQMRSRGVSTYDIAGRFGTTQQNVSFHTVKVLKADLAESGEPAGTVRAGYWS